MIVYIEDCLIENFLVTYLLLLTLGKVFKEKKANLKLVGVSLLGGLLSILYPLVQISGILLVLLKLAIGLILVCLYNPKGNLLAKYLTFIFLTGLYGGLNILIYNLIYVTTDIADNFPTYILIILLFLIYYLSISLIKLFEKRNVIVNFVYEVAIFNDEKIIYEMAFLDSGNTLVDPYDNLPVFVINAKLFSKLYKDISFEDLLTKNFKNLKNPHYIKSGFAGGTGKLLAFKIDRLEIKITDKNIQINNPTLCISYIGFEKNFKCNMLLGINAFA